MPLRGFALERTEVIPTSFEFLPSGSRERQRVDESPLAGARGYPVNHSLNLLGDWYQRCFAPSFG